MQISSYLPPSLGCTSWTTHPIIFRSSTATSITRVTLPLTVPRRGLEVVCTVKDMMEKEVNGETLPKKIISYAPQYLAYHQVSVVRPEQRILSSPPERCLSRQRLPVHSHPPDGWKLLRHQSLDRRSLQAFCSKKSRSSEKMSYNCNTQLQLQSMGRMYHK